MRPVTLFEKPPFPPYVCIYCGVGEPPRKWFLDIGMSLDYHFNPVNDGTPFVCDQCWDNLKVQAERLINNWVFERQAWDSPDRVVASYKWKSDDSPELLVPVKDVEIEEEETEEDDVRGSESDDTESVTTRQLDFSTGVDPSAEGHYSGAKSDDPSDEPGDEQSRNAFTAIFGEPPN